MPRHADYSHTSDCSSFEIANPHRFVHDPEKWQPILQKDHA
jgi:hypothetical protein